MQPDKASSEEMMIIARRIYQRSIDDDFEGAELETQILRIYQDLLRAYALGRADQKVDDDDMLGEFMRGEDN